MGWLYRCSARYEEPPNDESPPRRGKSRTPCCVKTNQRILLCTATSTRTLLGSEESFPPSVRFRDLSRPRALCSKRRTAARSLRARALERASLGSVLRVCASGASVGASAINWVSEASRSSLQPQDQSLNDDLRPQHRTSKCILTAVKVLQIQLRKTSVHALRCRRWPVYM